AGIGLFQRDLHIVAEIGPAVAAALTAAAPHHVAENILEDVGESAAATKSATARETAILEGGVAEAVIGGALLRVAQRLIGFVDFLEAMFRRLVAGIAIGVAIHGQLAERRLQRLFIGAFGDAQNFVEI